MGNPVLYNLVRKEIIGLELCGFNMANNEFREDFLKRFGEFLANEVNEMINCKEKK